MKKLTLTIATLAALSLACGGGDEEQAEAPPAPEPEEEQAEEEPEEEQNFTVSRVNADRETLKGAEVTVDGYYFGLTKQDDQLNVAVYVEADQEAEKLLCVLKPIAEMKLNKMSSKDSITVKGTVQEETFMDNTLLDPCFIVSDGAVDEEAAPAAGAAAAGTSPKGGKRFKGRLNKTGGKTGTGGKRMKVKGSN